MCYEANKIYRKKYPGKWREEKNRYYKQFSGSKVNHNHRQRWTNLELNLLNANIIDRELHQLIGRSVKAIQVKRARVRKEIPQ